MKPPPIFFALLTATLAFPALAENGVNEPGNGDYTVTYSNRAKIDITGVQPMMVSSRGSFNTTSLLADKYLAEPIGGAKAATSLTLKDRTLIDAIAAIEGNDKTIDGSREVNLAIAVAIGYALSDTVGKDLSVTDVTYNAFDGKTYGVDTIKGLSFASGEENGMKDLTRVMGFLSKSSTKGWFNKSKASGDDFERNVLVNGLPLFDKKGNPLSDNLPANAALDVEALSASITRATTTIKEVVTESGGGESGDGGSSSGSSGGSGGSTGSGAGGGGAGA